MTVLEFFTLFRQLCTTRQNRGTSRVTSKVDLSVPIIQRRFNPPWFPEATHNSSHPSKASPSERITTPESLSIASPSAGSRTVLISRNTAGVAISILLTLLDSWAAVAFGGTLYRVSAHHPIWFTGVVLLFVSLSPHWQEPGTWRWLSGRVNHQPSNPILKERRVTMPRSLGKMSAYKLFNWRDRPPTPSLRPSKPSLNSRGGRHSLDSDPQGRHGSCRWSPATTHPAQSTCLIDSATIGIYCPRRLRGSVHLRSVRRGSSPSTSCSATSSNPACCSHSCSWQPPNRFHPAVHHARRGGRGIAHHPHAGVIRSASSTRELSNDSRTRHARRRPHQHLDGRQTRPRRQPRRG